MIHTYSLVHDDLPCMDDDDLRRGRPTLHVKFDEATAVLAGDALHTEAFATLAELSEASLAPALVRTLAFAAGLEGMVGGRSSISPPKGAARARRSSRRSTAANRPRSSPPLSRWGRSAPGRVPPISAGSASTG